MEVKITQQTSFGKTGSMTYQEVTMEVGTKVIIAVIRYKENAYLLRNGRHGEVQILSIKGEHYLSLSEMHEVLEVLEQVPEADYELEFDSLEGDEE